MFYYKNRVKNSTASILLVFSIFAGLSIANYDLIKRVEWSGFKIETFRGKVDQITNDALKKIQTEVDHQKKSVSALIDEVKKTKTDVDKQKESIIDLNKVMNDTEVIIEKQKKSIIALNKAAENTKNEMEKLNNSVYKYAFYIVDPFTGEASTGGGHARGDSWASQTDLTDKLSSAEGFIDKGNLDRATDVANQIDKFFPNYPGTLYIRFLINKRKGNEALALKQAESIVKLIQDQGFTDIHPKLIDVFKFVIEKYKADKKKGEALIVAKTALKIWPKNDELLKLIHQI